MKINKTISIPQSLKSKINNYLNKSQKKQILFTKTNKDLNKNKLDLILNLHKSNDIRRLNKFYEKVNECLDDNGIFISCWHAGTSSTTSVNTSSCNYFIDS